MQADQNFNHKEPDFSLRYSTLLLFLFCQVALAWYLIPKGLLLLLLLVRGVIANHTAARQLLLLDIF
jgi:hypothetical protein